jgi:hypothetical protein
MDTEKFGPAERIIGALLAYTDHLIHNRPGLVKPDARTNVGVRWEQVTHLVENGEKVVYRETKVVKKTERQRIGVLRNDNVVVEAGREVGRYQPAGIFPEVAAWMYRQVAEVWKLDNEFAAKWASHAFNEEHRDLKIVLAAFMLCQSRKGDPVVEDGKVVFHDQDYRDVGEAICLTLRKDDRGLNPKLLKRIRDVLYVPQVAAINRELGFGKSLREPFLGRWPRVVEKWLRHREQNPKLLAALMKKGFRTNLIELAKHVGYKPLSPWFFKSLRWKQQQAKDGRRIVAIGAEVDAAESWEGLTEEQVCERIMRDKPDFKRLTSLVPSNIGITRAVMAAAIEAKSLSDKDLVIATPTLEELGLLEVQEVKARWEQAVKAAEDRRAANIARNVKSQVVKDRLEEAADDATKKAVEEVVRDIEIYFLVDCSGSMEGAIDEAKTYIAKFLQAFPLERLHVAVFNTVGRELKIPHASSAGVLNAFSGIRASGGTDYGAGVKALRHYRPTAGMDQLFFFVGDEQNIDTHGRPFDDAFRALGFVPLAFGLVRVGTNPGTAVQQTATRLGIPCFLVDPQMFADPYAVPRVIRNLVAATPVGQAVGAVAPKRKSLVETILETPLISKPPWAA